MCSSMLSLEHEDVGCIKMSTSISEFVFLDENILSYVAKVEK